MWHSHARVFAKQRPSENICPAADPLPLLRLRGGGLGRGTVCKTALSAALQILPKRQKPPPQPSPASGGGKKSRGRLKGRVRRLRATHPT
ncbi:hypothetical protein [Kingella potus]|uniref:hypothetical protein n=1 Tax=Kingella potus TaxID=265175 RepID=UPI001FD50F64|nr:hypothetical protein [Kingella potus]UOP01527.1 hypothetical protein LVJ84_04865 [Kingella potus]